MSAEDDIYRAVEAAILRGMTPRDFVKIARQAWSEELQGKQRSDSKEFDNLLAIRLVNGPA